MRGKLYPAIEHLDLTIEKGQTLGLVGESGCGKSVTSLSILRLLDESSAKITHGEILFKTKDLLKISLDELRSIRGREISMIFQEPMTSLNPVFTVGDQIAEVFQIHKHMSSKEARKQAIAMLEAVHIPLAQQRYKEYPHQLSGGMRQRVMIAMALSCKPELLIADEPTTALDVTIQAQILGLMNQVQQELGMAILLITHDLGVVSQVCDHVAIMYAGRIVESAKTSSIFLSALHPYTQGLLKARPKLGKKQSSLASIEGQVPSLTSRLTACQFADRCAHAMPRCHSEAPTLLASPQDPSHKVACWLYLP